MRESLESTQIITSPAYNEIRANEKSQKRDKLKINYLVSALSRQERVLSIFFLTNRSGDPLNLLCPEHFFSLFSHC